MVGQAVRRLPPERPVRPLRRRHALGAGPDRRGARPHGMGQRLAARGHPAHARHRRAAQSAGQMGAVRRAAPPHPGRQPAIALRLSPCAPGWPAAYGTPQTGDRKMSWFRELTPTGKRTFYASFLGWTIDALDYMVFTFVISTLVTLWGIDRGQAGMLGTVTLLFSAIGGWGAGILADRYGRVRVLQITILWFSACTVGIGFTQNFEQIFVLRALQGLGFGGEWAVGSVLMGEIIKARHRARAVGTVQSGWAVGWGIAALLYTIAFSVLPEQRAWRSLFWVGVLPALLVLYIRKHVPEPEIFEQARNRRAAGEPKVSPWLIFSPALLKTTLLSALLCTGIQGGYYAVTTWLPTYLKVERHLSVLNTGGYLLVIILGSFCG